MSMSGYHKRDWETFPMDKIKRVDRPTTMIDAAKVKRVREREGGFMKAASGDYGPILQREFRPCPWQRIAERTRLPLVIVHVRGSGAVLNCRKDYAGAKQGGRVKITVARESAACTYY
jgi:hypothetical protein